MAAGVRRVSTVRRRYLISLSVMGALVCALGSTGLFAALSDSARTSQQDFETKQLAGAADLQITDAQTATAAYGCSDWSEDLTTNTYSATDLVPGFVSSPQVFCLRNVGSQTVTLLTTVEGLTDTDPACTGDEIVFTDTTCGGPTTSEPGELSEVLSVTINKLDCGNTLNLPLASADVSLDALAGVGSSMLGGLGPDEQLCVSFSVTFPSTTAVDMVQRAQSDHVSFRYKFVGSAS